MPLEMQISLWNITLKWNQNSLFATVRWLSKINYIFLKTDSNFYWHLHVHVHVLTACTD